MERGCRIRYKESIHGAVFMKSKRFQKSPLWDWSYNNPQLDQKLTQIHKNLKEVDGFLAEQKGKNKKQKKK